MDDILKEVELIFRQELGDEHLVINYDSSPGSVEKWDSINNLSLINAIEEKYNISFPIEVIFKINSVKDICDFIIENKS